MWEVWVRDCEGEQQDLAGGSGDGDFVILGACVIPRILLGKLMNTFSALTLMPTCFFNEFQF